MLTAINSRKYDTSAMCTPTLNVPSSFALMDSASSRSFADDGSTVKIRSDRRSLRISNSRSGMLTVSFDRTDEDPPPRKRWQTLHGHLRELFGREVAVLEQRARLHFDVSDGTELLDKGTERMQRGATVS